MIAQRLKLFLTVFDDRFEDLRKGSVGKIVYRDFSAGLIVALTAIPMAMGFAIASGLRPEQGIIAGAVACLVGRTFGGSKYQVYGPTAAFIPVFAAVMSKYDHTFLVAVSMLAGFLLVFMGLAGWGRIAKKMPDSIVIGFTVGIAATIAFSNGSEALGLAKGVSLQFENFFSQINWWSLALALGTFVLCKTLLRISVFVPAPLIALTLGTVLASTLLAGKGIVLVADRFGSIPSDFFLFTPPSLPPMTWEVAFDIVYFAISILFISAIESLLCSSMADKLANNRGTPFNADKELWGQGLVQLVTPLLNGFPCTGAMARTATSIKLGATTPLAGYFKGVLKIAMAIGLASKLEHVPMACIAGILFWVATNMVKVAEVREQLRHSRFAGFLLLYTAVMVPATDFLTGVLSALGIYWLSLLLRRFLPEKEELLLSAVPLATAAPKERVQGAQS